MQPYTYLIGWSSKNVWYYGAQYGKKSHPSSLWRTYFTSSKYVKSFRTLYGEPDVVEVRKVFNEAKEAQRWETEVLIRLEAVEKDKWLNRPMNAEVKFPFQKLQKMWLTEPIDDNPQAFNRICIRYNDAILLAPASAFRAAKPTWGLTRADTNEHDFNVHFIASVHLPEYIINEVIND
jgi:hypothetical protein